MQTSKLLHEYIGAPGLALAVIDFICITISAAVAIFLLKLAGYPDVQWLLLDHYRFAIALTAILSLIVFYLGGVYRAWRGASIMSELRTLLVCWVMVLLIMALLALGAKMGVYYSRIWVVTWFFMAFSGLVFTRIVLRLSLRSVRKMGVDIKPIVIVGGGGLAARVVTALNENTWVGFKVIGYFEDREDAERLYMGKLSIPWLGKIEALESYIMSDANRVEQVWIALPLSAERRMRDLLNNLRHSTVDIRLIPDIFGFKLLNHSLEEVAGLPVINLSMTPMTGVSRTLKMLEDYSLSALILVLVSPLMVVIAAAVKLTSPGPVIFKQLRHGWDGRPITVYKFRTMRHKSDDNRGFRQAQINDERLTPIGGFLRRHSLDELPQFFNVLQGNMSVVGPRPHPIELNKTYMEKVDGFMLRHKVKPGITGWAQVNGCRGETEVEEKMRKRIQYDLEYIENWSLTFDIKIVLLSLLTGFTDNNAY